MGWNLWIGSRQWASDLFLVKIWINSGSYPTFYSVDIRFFTLGWNAWGVKLTTHLHLVLRLRICGLHLSSSGVPLWFVQGQLLWFVQGQPLWFVQGQLLWFVQGQLLWFVQGQLFPLFKKIQKVYICILVTLINISFVPGTNEHEGHWWMQIHSELHWCTDQWCMQNHKELHCIRGLLEKYPTFGREKETGLLGALDT